MIRWHFKPKAPGDTIRESVHSEFFATDAISDPGMALVREGIQNSLDAGREGEKVLVRILVSGTEGAVPAASLVSWFAGAWGHFQASAIGLRAEEVPCTDTPCAFLAFEDFGTQGLQGDPAQPFRSRSGQKNHFYHFFRAEGQSDKDVRHRGIWGVGKDVFSRSSRIRTVFGLTVRADDGRRMLMGRAMLKHHWVGDDFCHDGYFGVVPDGTGQLVMPVADDILIDQFCSVFDLQRGADAGLSLIVPWPDTDITDQALVRAVMHDYFYPILAGQLDVIVETPSVQTVLDAGSLISEAHRVGGDFGSKLQPTLELADWARRLPDDQKAILQMPDPDRAWQWSERLVPPQVLASLREAYLEGKRFAVRVPVSVRKKDGPAQPSFFDVYLVRDTTEDAGRPTFIREGIIISRVDAPRTRGVRAMVVSADLPLAGFLRAAENPSHTEWQHVRLKDQYKFGYATDLKFVKRSVHEIVRILTAAEKEEDPTLLIDFFSLPAAPEEEKAVKERTAKPAEKPGPEPQEPEPPPPPPRPQRFRIQKVRGGFVVVPGDEGAAPPARLDIRVAYNIRRGNPLKKYAPADFQVDQPPIRFDPQPQGVDLLECAGNHILAAIRDPHFSLHVTGFDEIRDLYVRAVPKDEGDANTTA